MMRQTFIWNNLFTLHFAAYCFLLLDRFNVSKLKDFYGSKGWNISLVMEWMKTIRGGNIWNEKSKHLPVSSIVFSSVGKKKCLIQPHRLKAAFEERKKYDFICVKIL